MDIIISSSGDVRPRCEYCDFISEVTIFFEGDGVMLEVYLCGPCKIDMDHRFRNCWICRDPPAAWFFSTDINHIVKLCTRCVSDNPERVYIPMDVPTPHMDAFWRMKEMEDSDVFAIQHSQMTLMDHLDTLCKTHADLIEHARDYTHAMRMDYDMASYTISLSKAAEDQSCFGGENAIITVRSLDSYAHALSLCCLSDVILVCDDVLSIDAEERKESKRGESRE